MSIKPLVVVCVASICVLSCAYGAEQAPAAPAEQASDTSNDGAETTDDEAERTEADDVEQAQETPDIFVPSENISEDIAVPFPVDI